MTLIPDFRGALIDPGDPQYASASRIYNRRLQRQPALIAQCAGVADVRKALRLADERGLEVAVRAGGHGHSGQGSIDGGVVIDLRLMRDVHVDPVAATAWVGAGSRAIDVIREAAEFGLVPVTGQAATIGITGLVLGIGEGYFTPRYGFGADSVLAAELVTADGRVLQVSADQHPDLFWALRGAGPNFGVVTAVKLRLHPLPDQIFGGVITFGPRDFESVARHAWEVLEHGSSGFFPHVSLLRDERGEPCISALVGHVGPREIALAELAALRACGTAVSDDVRETSYIDFMWPAGPEMQALEDFSDTPRHAQDYYRVPFGADPERPIEVFLGQAQTLPAGGLIALWRTVPIEVPNPGVVPRLPGVNVCILNNWTRTDEDQAGIAWVRDCAQAFLDTGELEEASNAMNIITDIEPDRVRALYGEATYSRLQALKRDYDPTNRFRHNYNIPPG